MAKKDPTTTQEGIFFKQSSELEILISAAIVFAAVSVSDFIPGLITDLLNYNFSNNYPVVVIAVLIALFISKLLPISIIIHFILRFYWLSLLGLKSTFHQIHPQKLRYAPRYLEQITKRSNLAGHVDFVDKLCSSIFAFSFLTLFVFCFTTLSVSVIAGILIYLTDVVFADSWVGGIFILLLVLFAAACVISLFDFFSLGLIKKVKNKWVVRIYYPISRFMALITLSYFYRGLYYTFITNIPKRVAVFALPAYLCLAIVLLNGGIYETSVYADDATALRLGGAAAVSFLYKENFDERTIVQYPFIDEYYVDQKHLPLYIPITEQLDHALTAQCDSVSAINTRGFHWRKYIRLGSQAGDLPRDFDFDQHAQNILSCFHDHVRITLDDSVFSNQSFRFYKIRVPGKTTLLTTLDLSTVSQGDHVLEIEFLEPLGEGTFEIGFYKTAE